jgi:hypothetical protein
MSLRSRGPLRITIVCTALTLSLVVWAPPTSALVVVKRDFPELVARADQVVVGTVTAITQGQDDSGAPSTFVTFSDLTVLKGEVGPTLILRLYGGTTGNVAVAIPDMPTFTLGEREILFVAGNGSAVCPLVGVWQGRFHVRLDETRGTEVVDDSDRNPVIGLAGRELRRAPLRARTPAPPATTLDEFRQMVADELARPSADLSR